MGQNGIATFSWGESVLQVVRIDSTVVGEGLVELLGLGYQSCYLDVAGENGKSNFIPLSDSRGSLGRY